MPFLMPSFVKSDFANIFHKVYYSALSNTGTCTLIYFGKKILPVQAYLMYFWAVFGNFISKICIHEEQICHPVRLFYPVPVCDSVE